MVRTQIYLTDEEKKGLETAAQTRGVSQSDLIRRAIDALLVRDRGADRRTVLDEIAGIWADRRNIPSARSFRTGWRRRNLR